MTIFINGRFNFQTVTGVQRYALEIVKRMPANEIIMLSPKDAISGVKGHLWEQFILPFHIKNGLLWSPTNTGPLLIKSQVVSILDMSTLDHPEWFSSKFAKWYQFLLPRLAHRAKKILTISEYSRRRIVELCKIDAEKVIVTPLAVDEKFISQLAQDVNDTLKNLNVPTLSYLLALGSLEPRKNLGCLLKAWELAQPYLPKDLWLVLAGAKGKSLVFKNISFDNLPPRVYLTGYVPDKNLPALYSGAQAFIYPSLYEGFGLPPLEAMACGTPVIVSNTTSLPEVVGDAGLYVDPLDIDSIANAIKKIVSDEELQETLRKKGLARAKLFSWEKTAELTMKVLVDAAEGK